MQKKTLKKKRIQKEIKEKEKEVKKEKQRLYKIYKTHYPNISPQKFYRTSELMNEAKELDLFKEEMKIISRKRSDNEISHKEFVRAREILKIKCFVES